MLRPTHNIFCSPSLLPKFPHIIVHLRSSVKDALRIKINVIRVLTQFIMIIELPPLLLFLCSYFLRKRQKIRYVFTVTLFFRYCIQDQLSTPGMGQFLVFRVYHQEPLDLLWWSLCSMSILLSSVRQQSRIIFILPIYLPPRFFRILWRRHYLIDFGLLQPNPLVSKFIKIWNILFA